MKEKSNKNAENTTPGGEHPGISSIRAAILRQEDPDHTLLMIQNLMVLEPQRCDHIFDLVPDDYFKGAGKIMTSSLWNTIANQRQDLASEFLKKAVSQTTPYEHLVAMTALSMPDLRINMFKDLLDHAKATSPIIEQTVVHHLLAPALNMAINLGRGTALFDLIDHHPEITHGRWNNKDGAGNALWMWAENSQFNQPITQAGPHKAASTYILKKLVGSGVIIDDPVVIYQYGKNGKKKQHDFKTCLEMACWQLDEAKTEFKHVADALLEAGADWGDLHTKKGFGGSYLRCHPIVCTVEKKKALSVHIVDHTTSTIAMKLKM